MGEAAGPGTVGGVRGPLDTVLPAVLAVSSGLELEPTLHRIVHAAADLLDARYAALGVLGEGGVLAQFVYTGIDEATTKVLGPPPCGKGVLGLVIQDARPLRLDDVSAHPAFTGFPPHHPPMRSFLGVPIRARGQVYGRLYVTEKNGGRGFTAADEAVLQALAAAAGVAVDNARLYEQARRRQLWLEATGEIAADLLLSSDISQALRLIAQRALELTASDTAVIFVPADPDATLAQVNKLRVAVGVGLVADRLVDTVIPVAGSTSGAVFTDLRPRNVPGLAFDPEGLAAPLGPGLVVPLRSAQWRFGVLSLARRRGAAAYDEQEMRFTGAFAEQAALAMRGAAHQSAQRRLEILGERDRIARDLHDDVIQSLFAIGLAMQRTQRAATQPTVAVRIADHRHHLQQVVQRIRSTIFDLQPGPGQRQPVHATLHTVITELTTHAPLRTAVRISGQLDLLPAHLARHAEATVREAVSNAVRHSQATDLTVTVTVNNDLVLEVTDNGVGIPAGATRSGLRNLADRAAQVGGSFTLSPTDRGGTHLTWTAPLPPA